MELSMKKEDSFTKTKSLIQSINFDSTNVFQLFKIEFSFWQTIFSPKIRNNFHNVVSCLMQKETFKSRKFEESTISKIRDLLEQSALLKNWQRLRETHTKRQVFIVLQQIKNKKPEKICCHCLWWWCMCGRKREFKETKE
jgi:hypothetical protein